jgi:anti-sigma regulatory factor (Ser/Thr protein kinase)
VTAIAESTRAVSLTVPAKPDYVVLARLALGAVCRLAPLSPEEVGDLKLAMTEAAAMVVASEPLDEGVEHPPMQFRFDVQDDKVVLEVAGGGSPVMAEDERELSAAIIEATVDEYSREGDRMTLIKRLRPSSGG